MQRTRRSKTRTKILVDADVNTEVNIFNYVFIFIEDFDEPSDISSTIPQGENNGSVLESSSEFIEPQEME